MSSYVNFYLRVNDEFAPIGSYSRNSEIYQAIQHRCPYGKICSFTSADFVDIIHDLEEKIKENKQFYKVYENRYKMILQANNSLNEKIEAIADIEDILKDIRSTIKDISYAIDTFRVFINIIENLKFSSDEENLSNDYNHYIYAGIEAPGSLEYVMKESEN